MKKLFAIAFIISVFISCKEKTLEKVESRFSDGTPSAIHTYESDGTTLLNKQEFYPSDSLSSGSVIYSPDSSAISKSPSDTSGKKIQRVYKDWNFKNNVLEGEAHSFYPDGKPWSLHTYKEGKMNGPYKTWHKNGQLFIDGQYTADKESGIWKIYGEDGKLMSERNMDTTPVPQPGETLPTGK